MRDVVQAFLKSLKLINYHHDNGPLSGGYTEY